MTHGPLESDPAVRDACASTRFAVVHHPVVDSTQTLARTLLAEGASAGLAVVADRQREGRGRRGRGWQDDLTSSAGPTNIAVTVTTQMPAVEPGLLPLAAGLAVADAVDGCGDSIEAALKWPNDVLLDGKKVSGVLVDRETGVRDLAVVGCGINVDWRQVTREGDALAWTSIAEQTGEEVDRAGLLARLLEELERRLRELERGDDRLLAAYRARCGTLGTKVNVLGIGGRQNQNHGADNTLRGIARDVDAAGRLVVDSPGGFTPVAAGDITHLR